MRKRIVALGIAVLCGVAQASWVKMNVSGPGSGTGYTWTDLHFVNADTGWVVGYYRVSSNFNECRILKTTDGGVSWVQQHSGGGECGAVRFLDARRGWVMGVDGASSHRTTDGGESWIQMGGTGYSMDFLDSLHGWIADDNTGGWKTVDGGATWQILGGLEGSTVDFASVNVGWLIDNDNMRKTTNVGVDWTSQVTLEQADEPSRSMHFLDTSVGWLVGTNGQIRKTTDGGQTWLPQASGTTRHLRSVSFMDSNHGLACGYNVSVETFDGGATWGQLDTVVRPASQCFLAGNARYGVADGQILKYNGTTAISRANASRDFGLLVGRGVIRFTLPGVQPVRLALYDSKGARVSVPWDGILQGGTHRIEIPKNIAPGNYWMELHVGAEKVRRRVTLD
jgi:photosystem II stability/assembly factor-like uncharacterized protein